jgi:glycosyltransferase involved in cell wall biosynthesis
MRRRGSHLEGEFIVQPKPPNADGERGALFIMPTSSAGQYGPVGVWITAAGWAAAARRAWGQAWILTPQGVLSPEKALALASRPSLSPRAHPLWHDSLPPLIKVAAKDGLRAWKGIQSRRAALDGPWRSADLAFVWQHHELFQKSGFRLARAMARPLVLFVDAPIIWEERQWGVRRPGWGRFLERIGEKPQFGSADLVACVSEEVAAEVVRRGTPPERVVVTPCSVDPHLFRADSSGKAVRERLGLGNAFVVGWVGSFRRFHGIDLVLHAAAEVQESVPDLAVLLVGDGAERSRMTQLAETLGLRNVCFTGTVPYQEMPAHIAAMDIALVVDRADHSFHYSPLKLREYMACGKAVIAPRVGQIARQLSHEAEALLIDNVGSSALAAGITLLHRNPELRMRLGARAREWVVQNGTWDLQLEGVVEALSSSRHSDSRQTRPGPTVRVRL